MLVCKTVLLSTVIGMATSCSGNVANEPTPIEIHPPEVFEIDGTNWQREDSLGKSDTKLLSRYYEKNPSMIDSPLFKGAPTVYHGTKNRRRFYWIGGTATEPIWVCVHFENGAFQLQDGQGNPYQNKP
ncbi:hypothetical protein V144x_24140 [Gimesia aquarii]|uniref:Uncharacterized protein n=2 Tax=Gimesia aquarii TaxID=2527964 RepID=A0A517VVC5_9PLAN|nr:hypothetical protein V144x_24140 [Gimesia aquarii]